LNPSHGTAQKGNEGFRKVALFLSPVSGHAPGAHDAVHVAATRRFDEQRDRKGLGLTGRVQKLQKMGFEILRLRLEDPISNGLGLSIEQLQMKEEEPMFFPLSPVIYPEIGGVRLKGDGKLLLGERRDLKTDVEWERIKPPELAYHRIENSNRNGNAAFLFPRGIGIFEDEEIATAVLDLQGCLSSGHRHGLMVCASPPGKKLDVFKRHKEIIGGFSALGQRGEKKAYDDKADPPVTQGWNAFEFG
jgi:hypothetical protein